ncbi:MAG TPA: molybdopterin-synthase adenylyltransferase MoeB [Gemmatimonadales bacterium]|jgi:adenylyltransferase/sulfurtransferase|nr:molybdopterin-synthase adenylyltransferase MoeB [Gemmatimonadales bacterium]
MSIPDTPFSQRETVRYARQLTLPELGAEGQARLKQGRVLVIGAGGLGSPALLYLASAGIGTIGIVDFDNVERSNLHRQVIHGESNLGQPKIASAAERLGDLNPDIVITTHDTRLTSGNALGMIADYDVVVDGSDNFPTRYLVNDACVLTGKPLVYAAIFRFEGQATLFAEPDGPCYRCLYPEPPPPGLVPTCAEAGVLGVLPGVLGSIQALEAIKRVAGIGESLKGRLLVFDALRLRFRELLIEKDPGCPVCGVNPSVRELVDYEAFCGLGGATERDAEISVQELARSLAGGAPPLVLDVREPHEWEIAALEGATLIPLATLPARLAELDPGRPIVTVCHKGTRSMRALELLRAAGYSDVRSLKGGVDAWAREMAPDMQRY